MATHKFSVGSHLPFKIGTFNFFNTLKPVQLPYAVSTGFVEGFAIVRTMGYFALRQIAEINLCAVGKGLRFNAAAQTNACDCFVHFYLEWE